MLKDNEKNFSRLHMIVDGIVLVLSYFLAWMIRFVGPMAATAVRTRSFRQYMLMLVFIVPVYLLLYQAFTLYTPMRMQGRRLVLANIVKANSLGLLILMFTFYMVNEGDYFPFYLYYVLCDQYRAPMGGADADLWPSQGYAGEGDEPETADLCRLQPCCRGIY